MKVLVVERSSDGGHAHYCALLVEHLLKQGVDVVVLSKNEGSEFSRIVKARYRTGSLWKAVREENPDVVHLFPSLMPWEILPWLLVNRWHARKRTAYTVHNLELHEWKFIKSWAFRCTQRAVMRMVDVVAVQNEFTKRLLAATLPERKLHVVLHGNYCWFDGRKYTRIVARKELGITGDAFIVLFFGVVRPYKGVSFLVDAIRGLQGVHLYIVGKVLPDVAADAARWKEEPNVTVVDGYASNEDVERYYKAADVSVCAYSHVSTSGPIQISLAMRTPLIASAVDSMPEIVGDVALIVPPKDSIALREAILKLKASPALRKRLAASGYHKATVIYTWERTAAAMKAAYDAAA